ncbi:MAG: ribokinase [Clostridiales bacterium]|jgi:ribokinase|nr:ribokinase [Clostridiales bacterium]
MSDLDNNNAHIYVVGSINVDLCSVISELPRVGETVLAQELIVGLGGKGANQAVACCKLGGSVSMIAAVGNDQYGANSISQLQSYGVNCDNIVVVEQPTGIAIVMVVNADNSIIVSPNANLHLDMSTIQKSLQNTTNSDILIVQAETNCDLVKSTLQLAKSKEMRTIFNPAPASVEAIECMQYVDICVLNEIECEILTGIAPIDEVHVVLAIRQLYLKGVQQVVLTLGQQGSVVSNGQQVTYIDVVNTQVVDTTGAGDSYIGALATCLASGCDIVQAAKFASQVASITVSRKGASVAIPYLHELHHIEDLG